MPCVPVLTIDGIVQTDRLLQETLRISQTSDGLNSVCEFDLIDEDRTAINIWTVEETHVETDGDRISYYTAWIPTTTTTVTVVTGAVVYFAGILSRISSRMLGTGSAVLHCECCDYNILLEESVIDDIVTWGAQTDGQLITLIWAGGYVVGGVGILGGHVVPSGIVFDEVSFENQTVRQALDQIAAFCDCQWYVDYTLQLHYSTGGDAAPGWFYSGLPDGVNSFGYHDDITREIDSTNLVNQVFIVGGPTGLWFPNDPSIAAYGLHQAIVRDTSLVNIADMEDRGNAILAKHKDPIVTYRFKSYTGADLHAGQSVRLSCPLYDVDEEFLINSIDITFPSDGTPLFEIVCGGLDSGASAAAARLSLDWINDSSVYVPSGALCLASQGWSHDLTFTATDFETVEWEGPGGGNGTITTAGGQTILVQPGNTDDPGAMVAKTIVYLDTIRDAIDPRELFKTVDASDVMGNNKVMVAVCWPGIEADVGPPIQPEVLAGFQVFGSTVELQTFLNADNIIANSITANEIHANTLSSLVLEAGVAHMGVLNAGEIRMFDGVWNVNATGFRWTWGEFASQTDGEDQVVISRATGKFTAGAGAVTLDEDGITFDMDEAAAQIRLIDGGVIRGYFYSIVAGASTARMTLRSGPSGLAAETSEMDLRCMSLDLTSNRIRLYKSNVLGGIQLIIQGGGGMNVGTYGIEVNNAIRLTDGMAAPAASPPYATLYVDVADGDLKVKFADGFVRTIAADS